MIDQPVGSVMTRSVRTVSPEITACEVARTFADHGIGSVLVVAADGDVPLGIVTQSDVMRAVADEVDLTTTRAKTLMSAPLVTTTSGAEIHEAAAVMRDRSIRRLPVLDGEELVGILTTTDLAHYLPRLRNTILRERADAEDG